VAFPVTSIAKRHTRKEIALTTKRFITDLHIIIIAQLKVMTVTIHAALLYKRVLVQTTPRVWGPWRHASVCQPEPERA
jgi:hypothetical protein